MAERTAAERINEYKQLLDEGMITAEEFEQKKAKVLEEEAAKAQMPGPEFQQEAPKDNGNVFSGHYFSDKAEQQQAPSSSKISKTATGVLAYITWIGFLIAFLAGDKEGAKFHLNQGLVVNLFGLLSIVPVLGKLWSIFILVCAILGIINAAQDIEKEVPLIGSIRLL